MEGKGEKKLGKDGEAKAEPCLEMLPSEMWVKILSCLKHEDMLTSRLVCRDWMALVDDVLEPKIWKPHFAKNRVADALSLFLVKCRGTRFGSAAEVNEFLRTTVVANNENPFVNETVILQCQSVEQYRQLCEVFPKLVARFGDYIHHCLYFVHVEVPTSVRQIGLLFQLRNLRSLTIYCADWAKGGIRNNLDLGQYAPQPMRDFTGLTVLGDQSYLLIRALFFRYGHQIKRLSCWGHNLFEEEARKYAKAVSETFMNLEELKVCDVSSTLLTHLSRGGLQLKRLAIKMSIRDDVIYWGDILNALKAFSGTLEALHLQVEERQLHSNVYLYRNWSFPKVMELRVPFYFARKYGNDIGRSFGNLKRLQLVDTVDRLGKLSSEKCVQAIESVLGPLWGKLPDAVEIITIRYRKYVNENRASGPRVFKYKKLRADLHKEE